MSAAFSQLQPYLFSMPASSSPPGHSVVASQRRSCPLSDAYSSTHPRQLDTVNFKELKDAALLVRRPKTSRNWSTQPRISGRALGSPSDCSTCPHPFDSNALVLHILRATFWCCVPSGRGLVLRSYGLRFGASRPAGCGLLVLRLCGLRFGVAPPAGRGRGLAYRRNSPLVSIVGC